VSNSEIYKFALEHALKKIEKNMDELKESFPFVTVNGKWEICKEEDWNLDIFRGKEEFREIAISILSSLCDNYLSREEEDGILNHGCFNKPEGKGVDESLIWGDYYFMEALIKAIYSRNE
jgi:hypothetical protein